MSSSQDKKRRGKRQHGYRHVNTTLHNPIRVRSKRLEEVDQEKIAAAFWSLARRLAEEAEREKEASDSAKHDEETS